MIVPVAVGGEANRIYLWGKRNYHPVALNLTLLLFVGIFASPIMHRVLPNYSLQIVDVIPIYIVYFAAIGFIAIVAQILNAYGLAKKVAIFEIAKTFGFLIFLISFAEYSNLAGVFFGITGFSVIASCVSIFLMYRLLGKDQ